MSHAGITTAAVEAALEELGQTFPATTADRCRALLAELARWNRRVNLTSITDPGEMITRHVLDSLAVRELIEGETVLDVGTGAGFPGLPLAIAEPGRSFHLIDRSRRKVLFVAHVVRHLGLENVVAEHTRAEDYAPGMRFDTVIARAIAALAQLVAIAGHHVAEGGVFIAQKGRYPAAELKALPEGWDANVVELAVPGLDTGSRHAVLMRPK